MFNIDKSGKITITKGDTGKAILFVSQGPITKPTRYILNGTDKIILWVHKYNTTPTEEACSYLLKKEFTIANLDENGDVIIQFLSLDTSSIPEGQYVYTVKASTGELPDISTIFNKVSFIIE